MAASLRGLSFYRLDDELHIRSNRRAVTRALGKDFQHAADRNFTDHHDCFDFARSGSALGRFSGVAVRLGFASTVRCEFVRGREQI